MCTYFEALCHDEKVAIFLWISSCSHCFIFSRQINGKIAGDARNVKLKMVFAFLKLSEKYVYALKMGAS
jgi:hypothetical protein